MSKKKKNKPTKNGQISQLRLLLELFYCGLRQSPDISNKTRCNGKRNGALLSRLKRDGLSLRKMFSNLFLQNILYGRRPCLKSILRQEKAKQKRNREEIEIDRQRKRERYK